jgi:hypothetical protein
MDKMGRKPPGFVNMQASVGYNEFIKCARLRQRVNW